MLFELIENSSTRWSFFGLSLLFLSIASEVTCLSNSDTRSFRTSLRSSRTSNTSVPATQATASSTDTSNNGEPSSSTVLRLRWR